jgi:elongation factor P
MGMVSTSDFRKKLKVIIEGEPWVIVENEFVKPGKGQAFNRTRFKNLVSGRIIDKSFRSGEMFVEAEVHTAPMQYLYNDGDSWTFMNSKSFEQVQINKTLVEDSLPYLIDNCECEVSFWNDRAISVTPPTFMEFPVTQAEPAVRGDTATNVTKKVTISTGYEVDVPLFVKIGDVIKIDTRTGEYLGRAER